MKKKLPEPHLKFRPQSKTGVYTMQMRRKYGKYQGFNLRLVRNISPFSNEPLNRQVIGRMWADYHYYSSHAPEKVMASQAVKQRDVYWNKRTNRFGGKYNRGTTRVVERGLNSWM